MSGTKTNLSLGSVIYILLVSSLGIVALYFSSLYPQNIDFLTLVVFIVLSLAAELLPVALPDGYGVSVGFAVNFAAITVMGPFGGSLVAASAMAMGETWRSRKIGLPVVFNIGQILLASSLAGMAYLHLGGAPGMRTGISKVWVAYLGLALAYFLVNSTGVTGIIAIQRKLSFWRVWIHNVRDLVINLLALAPLGMLVAVLYLGPLGTIGVILLIVPLYLARYSFQQYAHIKDAHLDTIRALAAALDAKDTYTKGHSDRVAEIAEHLARKLDLPEERVEKIRYAALLHDIGKIGVHDNVLNKLGRLEDADFVHIQEHPVIGANMVSQVAFLNDVAEVIRHHHEWYDGHGYPDGIAGSRIPLESRIMAVADAYDAMTSDRVYRRGMSLEQAVEQLVANQGVQFDPVVVQAFVRLVKEGDKVLVS